MKNICKICISLLFAIIMAFSGINCSVSAAEVLQPAAIASEATVSISATKTTLEQGDAQTLSCIVSPSGGTTTFYSSNPSVATADQYGVVTAHAIGTATITARYLYNNYVYVDSVTFEVVPKSYILGIKNGTSYYIMNHSSKRLMGLATASDAALTNVNTGALTESARYQWIAEMQTDERFQLVSAYSATGKCLDVTGSNVDIYTKNGADYTKFTIERVNSEPYEGLYLIKQGSKYVEQTSNYDVRVTETLSTSCYWSFMAVPKQYAELFGHYYPEGSGYFNTNRNYMYFRTVFNSYDYAMSWSYTNNSPTAAYNCMIKRDDVFVFAGHGDNGSITFFNDEGENRGCIAISSSFATGEDLGSDKKYISMIEYNGLSHARAIIYLGCETGSDEGIYNIVDKTYEKGAHFVLGIEEIVCDDDMDIWLEYFLEGIAQGKNIKDAMKYVDENFTDFDVTVEDAAGNSVTTVYETMPTYTRGDSSQYLAIPN